MVDAAISESIFNMLEGCVPEYTEQGYDRPPSGSTISGQFFEPSHLIFVSNCKCLCLLDRKSCFYAGHDGEQGMQY